MYMYTSIHSAIHVEGSLITLCSYTYHLPLYNPLLLALSLFPPPSSLQAVTGFGGFKEMTKQRKWTQLAREVHVHVCTITTHLQVYMDGCTNICIDISLLLNL